MITAILSILINGFMLNLVMQLLVYAYSISIGVDSVLLHKKAFALSVMILCAVLLIGVTPFGEWIMRRGEKCRKGKYADFQRLQWDFNEVCMNCGINPADYSLYLSLKRDINALAAGDRTVAITIPLMKIQDKRQVQAVLAHELGHHMLGHAAWLRFTYFSGLVGRAAMQFYVLISQFFSLLGRIPILGLIARPVTWGLFILIKLLEWFLLIPFNLGAFFGSRRDEYAADRFAAQYGYAEELRDFLLYEVLPNEKKAGFFSRLFHTHPPTEKRIRRLEGEWEI